MVKNARISTRISRRAILALLAGGVAYLTTARASASPCPPPGVMRAKLLAEAVAARNTHASTNVDAGANRANASQESLWHQNEKAINELQAKLYAKYGYAGGKFPSVSAQQAYWHEFALGIALIVKSNKISGRYSGNCIHIACTMYADFYTKYSGVKISIFSRVKMTAFGRHAFLVVRCGNDVYIVDGWKDGGVVYGPLVFDSKKAYFVDPATGEAPTEFYAHELERLAGPTDTVGKTTF
jgi:hypothetical protein